MEDYHLFFPPNYLGAGRPIYISNPALNSAYHYISYQSIFDNKGTDISQCYQFYDPNANPEMNEKHRTRLFLKDLKSDLYVQLDFNNILDMLNQIQASKRCIENLQNEVNAMHWQIQELKKNKESTRYCYGMATPQINRPYWLFDAAPNYGHY